MLDILEETSLLGAINLSQRKYVLDILEETSLLGSKPVEIPMDPNVKLYEE